MNKKSKKLETMEEKLIRAGFKRKWLSDKSGYWFEKKAGKHFKYYSEPERELYIIEYSSSGVIDLKPTKIFKNEDAMFESMHRFKFEI